MSHYHLLAIFDFRFSIFLSQGPVFPHPLRCLQPTHARSRL